MANETLITDLVAQEAMQQLEQLDRAMEGTLQQFQNCARELAQGLKIPVEVTGDVDALRTLTNTVMRDAQQATQQLTQQLQQQQQVVANTTNTISRQLQAQENLNKAQREAFTQDQQAQYLAKALLGTRQQNYELLARYTAEMKANKDAQKQVNEQEKQGLITQEQAIERRAQLMAAYDRTKVAAAELTKILAAENREANAVQGSYQQLSQKLERLKMAYKQMTDAQKASTGGKAIEKEIQNLDARLKDLSADMGEHQRNVGNYAIAAQNMKGTLRELTEEIAQLTIQYNELSDEEQRSDVGMQLRDKITQLTEEAGKYKDVISDVKQSISASASDTRLFDSLIEAGQVFAATMGVAETACRALGMSEDSLQQSMLKVQQAMQAVQALQVIQNTLQKQSNLMKGIAIIQAKAAAAAARIEAAATASATGATKAQTVAQAAFNAVAKANPYVLLATAILTVIGLIVGYTKATEDATDADKEAAQAQEEVISATERHKESLKSFSQTYAQQMAEPLVKLKLLRDEWNALGNDLEAKRKYIIQHKDDLELVANAAGIAKDEVSNLNGVENMLVTNTNSVETAIRRRATAIAAMAEMVRITQQKLQDIDNIWINAKYTPVKSGTYIGHKYDADSFSKSDNITQEEFDAVMKAAGKGGGGNYVMYERGSHGNATLLQYGADIINKMRNDKAYNEAKKKEKEITDEYERRFKQLEKLYEENYDKPAEGFKPAPKTTPTSTPRTKSTKTKKSTKTSNSNKDAAKDEKELQDMLLQILVEANRDRLKINEDYSEDWKNGMLKVIADEKQLELDENEKKRKADLAELKKSYKAQKITKEKYLEEEFKFNEAYDLRKKAIEEAAAQQEKEVLESVAKHNIEVLAQTNEKKIEQINNETAIELDRLNQRYKGELALAQGNVDEIERIRADHAKDVERIEMESAMRIAKATIESLEKQVAEENLNEEEREELAKQLAEAKRNLDNMVTENLEKALDEQVQAEKDAADKIKEQEERKKELAQQWIDTITDGIGKIAEFMGAMYDNQISKIEELIDAEQQRYEAEVNHIEWLADRGAITTEEAEIRKRDAAERTAKVQEALEKRKAAAEYKKAIIEKANSAVQAIIATALAVTKALPNIPLSIAVGALGAIQVATILAQPIQKYAEGTKGKPHPGGLAVVGDGNRAELVMYGKRAWITPDSPTLVDLPKGAEVMPDASKVDLVQMGSSLFMTLPKRKGGGGPIIVNDYEALEGRVATNTKAVTAELRGGFRSMKREFRRQNFRNYINART